MDPCLVLYEPYNAWYPKKQVTLLWLYDELGLPHAKKKQLFGCMLDIISLHINPIDMIISMSDSSRDDLTKAIWHFIDTTSNRRRPLVEWQRLLGWINWGLNVYPLTRPALQSAYMKISGKQISHTPIFLNRTIIRNFKWLADTIEASNGIHVLDAIEWGSTDADLTIFCDASLTGLSFVVPSEKLGFTGHIPFGTKLSTIFYYEVLTITSAMLWASGITPSIQRLLIYLDSLNCVEMFNLLSMQEGYNEILLFMMQILITTKISLCIFHVPSADNVIADALSCNLPVVAEASLPSLQIHIFETPCSTLGPEE